MNDDNDDGYVRITLRMPKPLHHQLTVEADRLTRSMNAEIVQRLNDSFRTRPSATAHDKMLHWIFVNTRREQALSEVARIEGLKRPDKYDRAALPRYRSDIEHYTQRLREIELEPEFPAHRVGIERKAAEE